MRGALAGITRQRLPPSFASGSWPNELDLPTSLCAHSRPGGIDLVSHRGMEPVTVMRPFFSYYGAKYTVAKYAGPPRRDLIIEPFAGSAGYSTRWGAPFVKLFDISPDICSVWDFLIHSSLRDIVAIPDRFESYEEIARLPKGAALLVRFWIAKGREAPSGTLSPWYFKYRDSHECRVWGAAVKNRIISQKPAISRWTIDCASYEDIPLQDAHWHVDPPYNNIAGQKYPFSDVDYARLAEWCRDLPGTADVFDNLGADWLPFEPLCDVVSSRGRSSGAVSKEAMWRR